MDKLTVDEVEALLLEHRFEWQEECDEETGWYDWDEEAGSEKKPNTFEVVGLGEVKVWNYDFHGIDTNEAWLMFEVDGRTFRQTGQWVSFAGMYWDGDFTEVKPVQKVYVDYEEM
ncbi:hypothetical protein [Micromonospora sp. CB01531]|uniref:hypothetical protein n=1 Tax=Micromonospora sp. CB01531 TaxID=1718947 RepID=UPI00093A5A23|nr:hypothetical protein [Micromonospora sp. CB01531]OKI54553.1 hypothetical protein A6A27_32010 [Micromonospora sp. CB01531]